MAHSRRFIRPSTSSRQTGWGIGVGQVGAQVAITTSGKALVNAGIVSAVEGLTIVRIRGRFMAFLVSATAQLDGFSGAFGIGLVTNQAFAAGGGSVPGPVADDDWDGWMFHQYL